MIRNRFGTVLIPIYIIKSQIAGRNMHRTVIICISHNRRHRNVCTVLLYTSVTINIFNAYFSPGAYSANSQKAGAASSSEIGVVRSCRSCNKLCISLRCISKTIFYSNVARTCFTEPRYSSGPIISATAIP